MKIISIKTGYVLADEKDTLVVVGGDAVVGALANTKVFAFENATVLAYDDALVIATGNVQVLAYGYACVVALEFAQVQLRGHSKCEAYDNTTIRNYGKGAVLDHDDANQVVVAKEY